MNDWQLMGDGNWTNGTATVGLTHTDRGWRWGIVGSKESYELWSDAVRAASTPASERSPVATASRRHGYVKATRSRGGKVKA